jgi:hypothetical protein
MEVDLDQIINNLSDTIKEVTLTDTQQDKPPIHKEEINDFKNKLTQTHTFFGDFKRETEASNNDRNYNNPELASHKGHLVEDTILHIDHKLRRLGNKHISTYKRQLKAFKERSKMNQGLADSQHARNNQPPLSRSTLTAKSTIFHAVPI